jgi:hypothetical protein
MSLYFKSHLINKICKLTYVKNAKTGVFNKMIISQKVKL